MTRWHPRGLKPLQFGLRHLFVVVLLSAIVFWYIQHVMSRQRHVNAIVQVLGRRGCTIEFTNRPPLWWLGTSDLFQTPVSLWTSEAATDDDLKLIGQLTSLKNLELRGHNFTDAGIEYLKSLRSLDSIYVVSNNVTDRGLVWLGSLTNLSSLGVESRAVTGAFLPSLRRCTKIDTLSLVKTAVGDEAVRHIVEMWPDLLYLYLVDTDVTDRSLRYAQRLRRLVHLDVRYTYVTEAGVHEFERCRPDVTIFVPMFEFDEPR